MEQILRRLDLTSLRLFTAVCHYGSIARAAEHEFIAPSAVSRRVAELEAVVGLPLIQRHTRGVTVTPAGEMVLRHARRIIMDIETMGAELSRIYAGVTGHVRLVANLSALVQFLPEDLASFQRLFPEVDLQLEEQHSPDVLRMVRDRSADIGICGRIPGLQGLKWQPYRRDNLAAVLPSNHPLANARRLSLRDLAEEAFVGMREPSALAQMLAEQADALGLSLNVKIRLASLDVLCRMVHAGLGIAILPQQVAELYVNTLEITVRRLDDPWASREIGIVHLGEEQLSATTSTLLRFLSQTG